MANIKCICTRSYINRFMPSILQCGTLVNDNIFHKLATEKIDIVQKSTILLKKNYNYHQIKKSLLQKNAFNYTPIEIAADVDNIDFIEYNYHTFGVPNKYDLSKMLYIYHIMANQLDLDTDLTRIIRKIESES